MKYPILVGYIIFAFVSMVIVFFVVMMFDFHDRRAGQIVSSMLGFYETVSIL